MLAFRSGAKFLRPLYPDQELFENTTCGPRFCELAASVSFWLTESELHRQNWGELALTCIVYVILSLVDRIEISQNRS